MLGDLWFQELEWVRTQVDQLVRARARRGRLTPSDEALYLALRGREVELQREIKAAAHSPPQARANRLR